MIEAALRRRLGQGGPIRRPGQLESGYLDWCLQSKCQYIPKNRQKCMAGTTGLEPATSAVTGQRSNQLSYVPRLFFNNLDICHVESSGPQLSLYSLFSTISLLWAQFWALADTIWTPKQPPQRQDQVYQKRSRFGVHVSWSRSKKLVACQILTLEFIAESPKTQGLSR
jgi:hypothetical protein